MVVALAVSALLLLKICQPPDTLYSAKSPAVFTTNTSAFPDLSRPAYGDWAAVVPLPPSCVQPDKSCTRTARRLRWS